MQKFRKKKLLAICHVQVLEFDQFLTKIFTVHIAVYSHLYTKLRRIFPFFNIPDIILVLS